MTYLSGKAKKRKQYIQYGVLVIVFLSFFIFWSSIKKTTYSVLEPVIVRFGITKHSFNVFPEFITTYTSSHKTLAERNKNLEVEIENLENALAEKDARIREYQDIYSLSSSSVKQAVSLPIPMYPLMEDVTKLYSTVLLSKGYKDGVTTGATVYLRGNQAVCTIQEVYAQSSLCLLFTSSGFAVEGVTSSSSITVSLVGRGGHYLADVARDTPIAVGEYVYMRSNPKMILGTVKAIANNNQDTSWHVFVEGAYNPLTSSIFYVQP